MQHTEFSILTFNVNGQRRFGFAKRAETIGEVLQKSAAGIIGFQEFGIDNWSIYTTYLPDYEVYQGLEAGDIFVNPIAWNSRRFSCLFQNTYWLSETPEHYSRGWDGSERAVSIVVLEDLITGKKITHLNVHLDNIGEVARTEGVKQILNLIANLESTATIITGDFNCSPYLPHSQSAYTRTPYDLLRSAGFTDAWAVANPQTLDVPHTYHGYKGKNYLADEYGTWHTDWIMVKHLSVESCAIIQENETEKLPSDHYPVIATLNHIQ